MATVASWHGKNAFGTGSPHWNLAFPNGNLTAAEILAYLPHWLKSVDVIDRFVANGATASVIAVIINEFRNQPRGKRYPSNSVRIMMTSAMRSAGFKDWTIGAHDRWPRENGIGESCLSVKDFRPPRVTHPTIFNNPQEDMRNAEVEPIAFRDLALHLKKHPAGNDALDLTRCVQYALLHQNEDLLFPTDFAYLITKLGGPQTVTTFHYDREAFARREKSVAPLQLAINKNLSTSTPQTHLEKGSSLSYLDTPATVTPEKQENNKMGGPPAGDTRRSRRLIGRAINLREEDSDTTEKSLFDSPQSTYPSPAKKRKVSHRTSGQDLLSNESDFVQDESEPDDEISEAEVTSDEDIESPSRARYDRAAAQKARLNIQSSFKSYQNAALNVAGLRTSLGNKAGTSLSNSKASRNYMTSITSSEAKSAALKFSARQPKFLQPPTLSADRLRVDSSSIFLYAADGCRTVEEMWASALSSTRFGGPRRSPPFRELYRLTDPSPQDDSDWAENIRWAKEQHRAFGSVTWTEYDYHLELITQARRETLWVSEEAVQAGM